MTNPSPRCIGIFIPQEILDIEELSLFEIHLLAQIDALYCKEYGGCFASNEYLATKLRGVKENTIAKGLTNLRNLGLIEDVSFDGRKRVIRALIGKAVDKHQSNAGLDKNPTLGLTKIQPCVGEKSIPTYIEYKDEKKGEREASQAQPPALAPSSLSSKKKKVTAQEKEDSKIPHGQFVKLTEKEYTQLLQDNGHDKLNWMINKLNSYKGSHGIEYKSDYMTMIKGGWLQNSYQEEVVDKKGKINPIAINKSPELIPIREEFCLHFASLHRRILNEKNIKFSQLANGKGIEFGNDIIYFDAANFKTLFISALRKNSLHDIANQLEQNNKI